MDLFIIQAKKKTNLINKDTNIQILYNKMTSDHNEQINLSAKKSNFIVSAS